MQAAFVLLNLWIGVQFSWNTSVRTPWRAIRSRVVSEAPASAGCARSA